MATMAELMSNSVQEMASSGQEPPVKYFYKGNDGGVLDSSVPLIEIPVVDLGLLPSPSTSAQELDKLKLALSTWGCFQVINHGMTSSFLDKIREVSKQFFASPMEEKQKYSREADSIEGYGNDMILSDHQTVDWTDRLYLTISPEDQRKIKFWPENPEDFRETLHEYTVKLQETNDFLLRAMARSLNLEESCFLDQYGEQPLVTARFNFYPPCPKPGRILGVKPHADASAVTFLLQDKEVEGLQFLKDNEWFRVPIIPHALLVNVGDQVEIMSNGIFKSPVHRVVTNTKRERNTLAVFCIPESDNEIKPADGLISESRPSLYRKVKDYVSIYFQHYQQGKRPIEAVKI
ncbi:OXOGLUTARATE/IRON-DEPENDENT DIOXYGENASE [Salix viminalis]|uniref:OXOGLUTARATE/IRON-DEPENDENT DIOXYGENASE n=1 Tax=Salix viminalis TaxID=40686 RepID=A0A9Q0NP02_SALVM|nr:OXOGLUTARATE/IRON-DEPENDENT DIOXYGENASE [Salix viminalis]